MGRIASGNHQLRLTEGDTAIFSSRTIPGNEVSVGRIINQLAERGIGIVTARRLHIHVSGHPSRPELEQMYRWIRPDIVIPVHGETRHMREQARVALAAGVPDAVIQSNGEVVRLAPGGPDKIGEARVGRLVLDGDVILPADGPTMNQRRKMAYGGLIAVTLSVAGNGRLTGEPSIRPFGVPVEADLADFLARADPERQQHEGT